MYIQVKLTTTS